MCDHEIDELRWYVLRFLYRNQVKVRARFAEDGIETFSPSVSVVEFKNGKYIKVSKPLVWDLFFVHSTRRIIDPYVAKYDNFQYVYKTGGKYKEPLVVPEVQMNMFIRAVNSSHRPLFFTPLEIDLTKGTRIRLIGGTMDGYEGVLLKVVGARSKRLIVEIPNVMMAAVEADPDLIELLN